MCKYHANVSKKNTTCKRELIKIRIAMVRDPHSPRSGWGAGLDEVCFHSVTDCGAGTNRSTLHPFQGILAGKLVEIAVE